MSSVAVIVARMKSSRLPGKNIRSFHGVPMIQYPVRAICESAVIDSLIVATESEQIAETAKAAMSGITQFEWMRLSDEVADSQMNMSQLLSLVLETYKAQLPKFAHMPRHIFYALATNPFTTASDIQMGLIKLIKQGEGAVIPVSTFEFPIWRSFKLSKCDMLELNWKKYEFTRSQDVPESYHDVGQWYWLNTRSFMKDSRVYQCVKSAVVIPRFRVQDIDTEEDWLVAEHKYAFLKERE